MMMTPLAANVDYPVLFFFEKGEWWDYVMLAVVIAALAGAAWLTQRFRWAVVAFLIIIPICLTIFWWPHSTQGTNADGWFAIVKQYSALLGSLSLVALQVFPKLRTNKWYLLLPPLILTVNIVEAVIRDFQCYSIHGIDPTNMLFTQGGPWNIMNGIAGILNILAISGWIGIYVAKDASQRIVWLDLTIWWIIAYDLWNFAYVYNCLADRAWYSGVALLAACTLPVLAKFGRGAWIQYRAYTLTFWSAVVLTFPNFVHHSMFTHRSSHNTTALLLVSSLALIANVAVFIYHVYKIAKTRRNPVKQEVYADEPKNVETIRETASLDVQLRIAERMGPEAAEKSGLPRAVALSNLE